MHILEKYIAALAANDADKIAACFTEDGLFDDTGAMPYGYPRFHYTSQEEIRKAFHGLVGDLVPKILKLEGNTMDYDCYSGPDQSFCTQCTGTAIIENGLISEYYVRPRK